MGSYGQRGNEPYGATGDRTEGTGEAGANPALSVSGAPAPAGRRDGQGGRSAIARHGAEGVAKPSITEVLEALFPGIHLRRDTGGWTPVRCPFHPDRDASASYSPDAQSFRCHACGVHGDGLDLIQEFHGCDFATARLKVEALGVSTGIAAETEFRPARSKLTARRTKGRAALVRKRYSR